MLPSLRSRHLGLVIAAAITVISPVATAQSRSPITVQWLGHAAFEITSSGGTRILIDPFISGNPSTPDSLKNLSHYKPAAVLVTHSHDDHALDAKKITEASGAMLISVYEWVNAQKVPQSQAMGGNVGGTFTVGDVKVHLVPAVHSSEPGGRPL